MTAYTKNVLRTISGNFRRYILIMLIITLGVSFYVGLRSTSPDMKVTLDNYFKDQNTYDIEIISRMTEEEIKDIEKLEIIKSIDASYFSDVYVGYGSGSYLMRMHSLSNKENMINKPVLISGNLPINSNECVIEESFSIKHAVKIGEVVQVGSMSGMHTENTFTITGIIHSPVYISEQHGNSLSGLNLYSFLYVKEEVFNTNNYTNAYVRLNGTDNMSRFEDEYKKICEEAAIDIKQSLTNDTTSLFILDLRSNIGFVTFESDCEKIDSISKVFPFIFFLVAILVSFTIMVRLIENERNVMGTMRSLGYGSLPIFNKYLIYALMTAIPGSIIGISIGFWFFPSIIFNLGYKILYVLPGISTPLNINICIISMILALLSVLVPTIIISFRELITVPSALLRPKTPPAGKRIILERIPFLWKRMSFSNKVTARNILRGKRRSLMTLVGIIGCTAILVAGFGLDNSINDIVDNQYNKLHTYDFQITLNESATLEERTYISKTLDDDENVKSNTEYLSESFKVFSNNQNDMLDVSLIVPTDEEVFNNYIHFEQINSHKNFILEQGKVIISQKIGYQLNVKQGDFIQLIGMDEKIYTAEISDITVNYINHFVYMPKDLYKQIFNKDAISNTIVGYTNDLDAAQEISLSEKLLKKNGVGSFVFTTFNQKFLSEKIDSMKIIVVVLIACGALLAFVVLFSLTGLNIDERIRELATLKVLGFYDSEASNYIFRENIVLTIIGIAFGLISGYFLHQYVIMTSETTMMMFGKKIHVISYVISGALSFGFMIIVNLFMNRSIKKIDMIESLKSVE